MPRRAGGGNVIARAPTARVTPLACVFAALCLLLLPLRWLLAAALAAAVHESCHLAALRLCRGRAFSLRVGAFGAQLRICELSAGQELLCALAGPLGSFALLPLHTILPLTAFCGAVQGVYNLLPQYPLDGGRALRCLTELLCPGGRASRAVGAVGTVIYAAAMAGLCFLLLRLHMLFAAGTVTALAIRTICGNRTCKAARSAV